MASPNVETIAAPITPPGKGPVAIVRVSGPATKALIGKLTPRFREIIENPRLAVFAPLLGPGESVLDQSLFTYFAAPRSYTGEDSVEIAIHGSPYILKTLLRYLDECGVRMARAGEFSERAFLNGKLDLSQVEAVADLISAETEVQAKIAREQLEGKLSEAVSSLGEPLRDLLAEIEAYIDFPEEDIEPLTHEAWARELRKVSGPVQTYCESFQRGKLCREGALVVLAGLPNAGKSSLLNRLLGEDRAIVTPIAGTTRDSIEELCSIEGYAVRLCDTAGLLDESAKRAPDEVEAIGIERSWKKLRAADLVLYVVDSTHSVEAQFTKGGVFEKIANEAKAVVIVFNKQDAALETKGLPQQMLIGQDSEKISVILASAKSGQGLTELRQEIVQRVFLSEVSSGSLLIANERHHRALTEAREEIQKTLQAIAESQPPEIIAFHLRTALTTLNDIIGVTYTDDILGRIFSKFCIGK